MRFRLKLPSSPVTAKITSTFAATTCARLSVPATPRVKTVRRAKSRSMSAGASGAGSLRKATQSPAVGRSASSSWWCRRPDSKALPPPSAVQTS